MFRFLCTKPLQIRRHGRSTTTTTATATTTIVCFLHNPSLRFISHLENPNSSSFTVDYLINSCGLSAELALKASQQITLKSSTKPDSVLALFQSYGFTNTHITKIVTKLPLLLLSDPTKILKPKIEFFINIGIKGPELAKLTTTDPSVLTRSLQKQIIPSFNLIKGFLHSNTNIAFALGRCTWILHRTTETMGPNVALLKDHGVPESSISRIIMLRPRVVCRKPEDFSKMVEEVTKMGFDPLKMMFIHGLTALLTMSKDKWEEKLAVYKSFGWSEDEVILFFKKQPICMTVSVKKLRTTLDFFMNKLNWSRVNIFKNPTCLFLSHERRILPRYSVVEVLLSKGLIEETSLGSALTLREDKFLKRFVIKYQVQLPQLLKVYESKKMEYL